MWLINNKNEVYCMFYCSVCGELRAVIFVKYSESLQIFSGGMIIRESKQDTDEYLIC